MWNLFIFVARKLIIGLDYNGDFIYYDINLFFFDFRNMIHFFLEYTTVKQVTSYFNTHFIKYLTANNIWPRNIRDVSESIASIVGGRNTN